MYVENAAFLQLAVAVPVEFKGKLRKCHVLFANYAILYLLRYTVKYQK